MYVVHGWKIEEPDLGKCIMNLAPEVIEIGMRLVCPANEKYGIFGEILARVGIEEKTSAVSFSPPEPGTANRLAHGLKLMKLEKEVMDGPKIWIVMG